MISMDGGTPRKSGDKLVRCELVPGREPGWYSAIMATAYIQSSRSTICGRETVPFVPASEDLTGVQWVAEDLLVAASNDRTKLVVFDLKTQKWSDLVPVTNSRSDSSTGPIRRISSTCTTPPGARNRRLFASGSPITRWKPSPA